MRIRIAILTALVLVLIGVGVFQWRTAQRASVAVAPAAPRSLNPTATELDTFFQWHDVHSFAEARAMLADAYRLAPDARFLDAVADVPLLAGSANVGTASAQWMGDRWIVRCGEDSVGVLPEYPSWADARALLAPWATRWARTAVATAMSSPSREAMAPVEYASDPLGTLAALDHRWRTGERGGRIDAEAAEALAWLAFASARDVTRRSDLITGRALAALALAEASGESCAGTEVLLARLCGYASEARAIASALPATAPRRAWAAGDTTSLSRLADAATASVEARLLRLHGLAEHDRFAAWRESFKRDFPRGAPGRRLAVATGLGLHRFESATRTAWANVFETALETQRWTHVDTADVRRAFEGDDIARSFERLLARTSVRGGGPLLRDDVLQAHERAQGFTALTVYAEHLRRTLGVERGSRAFARRLGEPGDGAAGEYAQWYAHLVEANWRGEDDPPVPLARDVVELREVGPGLLQTTYEEAVGTDRSIVPVMTRALLRRMDTRPEDRAWFVWTTVRHEIVPADRDALLAATAGSGGFAGGLATMWLAARNGDDASLVRAMGSADVPAITKRYLLTLLTDSTVPMPLPRLRPCAEAAVAAHPDDPMMALAWSSVLESHDRRDEARRMLERWLDREHDDLPALEEGSVLARVADLFLEDGMPERALTVLRSDRSCKFAIVSAEARALDALGDTAAAMALAREQVARYSDSPDARGLEALLHLRHGRYEAAAEALAPTSRDADFWRWRFATDFERAFRGRRADALAAVSACAHRFGPGRSVLAQLGWAYQAGGDPETGFQIVNSVMGGGIARPFEMVSAYQMACAALGREEALKWFDSVPVPQPLFREIACETGVARGLGELAWLDPLSDEPRQHDWGVLVRAATLPSLATSDPRRRQLASELHERADSYYLALARYVAEGGDEAAVFSLADSPKTRNEVFYWAGLRAEQEGRELDAAVCYQLCQELALTTQGEWLWSRERRVRLLDPLHPLRTGGVRGPDAKRAT